MWIFCSCCHTMGLSLPHRTLSSGTFISHRAELPKAQQAWGYVLQHLMGQLGATSQIFTKHQGNPKGNLSLSFEYSTQFEYSQLWEILPVVGTKEPNPKTIHKSRGPFLPSLTTVSSTVLHSHLPSGTCLFLSHAEMSLTAHRDGTKGHRPAQLTARHRTDPSSSIPSPHNPSWMISSLPTAQIPPGLVSRTDVHWFTAGRLFGRATTRSIIIFLNEN